MNQPEHIAARPDVLMRPEPGLRRVLAANPSPMTHHGTNTYILGEGRVAVIDPGPEDRSHFSAILSALNPGEAISHIFVTHAHLDHSPLARPLARVSGASVFGFGDAFTGRSPAMSELAATRSIAGGEGIDTDFHPDTALADGDVIDGEGWALRAIHTPGHLSNHLCFAWQDTVFSGDHVMGWASSLVSPPDGDMGAYMRSLDKLSHENATRLYPGHGEAVKAPAERISFLTTHRHNRENEICSALTAGAANAQTLAQQIYIDTPPPLLGAAARNVFAHLIDLSERRIAAPIGTLNFNTRFRLL